MTHHVLLREESVRDSMTESDLQFVQSVKRWRDKDSVDDLLAQLIVIADESRPKSHPKLGGFISADRLRKMRDERKTKISSGSKG